MGDVRGSQNPFSCVSRKLVTKSMRIEAEFRSSARRYCFASGIRELLLETVVYTLFNLGRRISRRNIYLATE